MTKRPSPFESNICRQFKIHLNNYENDLTALKSIEDRTLKKLIDGSRKSHSIILNTGDHLDFDNGVHNKRNFMQKYVTNYFTVNGMKINEKNRNVISPLESLANRCFFCDSNTSSVYQCIQCLEFYCSACSFVSYESFEDKRICLSCS